MSSAAIARRVLRSWHLPPAATPLRPLALGLLMWTPGLHALSPLRRRTGSNACGYSRRRVSEGAATPHAVAHVTDLQHAICMHAGAAMQYNTIQCNANSYASVLFDLGHDDIGDLQASACTCMARPQLQGRVATRVGRRHCTVAMHYKFADLRCMRTALALAPLLSQRLAHHAARRSVTAVQPRPCTL